MPPHGRGGPPGQHGQCEPQCEEECAEEECDPAQCGAEDRPPLAESLVCGIDTRPMLPVLLAISTVLGALCMMVLQLPLLSLKIGIPEAFSSTCFLVLYAATLGLMVYCALADPGQLPRDHAASIASQDSSALIPDLPRRTHTSWQYKRPVRRYDHYCRWLTNCIGLLNHREFLAMLVGFVTIAILGLFVDIVLAIQVMEKGFWVMEVWIFLHLVYSMILLGLATPILRIHIGLVSRNELASEWRSSDFYVVKNSKRGGSSPIPVKDLSDDDEFNSLFDTFQYEKNRNPYDKGCSQNCFNFWCIPRWAPEQMGEF